MSASSEPTLATVAPRLFRAYDAERRGLPMNPCRCGHDRSEHTANIDWVWNGCARCLCVGFRHAPVDGRRLRP